MRTESASVLAPPRRPHPIGILAAVTVAAVAFVLWLRYPLEPPPRVIFLGLTETYGQPTAKFRLETPPRMRVSTACLWILDDSGARPTLTQDGKLSLDLQEDGRCTFEVPAATDAKHWQLEVDLTPVATGIEGLVDTGELLGRNEAEVGKMKITRITPKLSYGETLEDNGVIVGAITRPKGADPIDLPEPAKPAENKTLADKVKDDI